MGFDLREKRQAIPFATVDRVSGRLVGSTRFAMFEHFDWQPGNPAQRGLERIRLPGRALSRIHSIGMRTEHERGAPFAQPGDDVVH